MYSYWGFRFISLEKGDNIVVVHRDRFEESVYVCNTSLMTGMKMIL